MAENPRAMPPWQNFPPIEPRSLNITFTTLIICNFPHKPNTHHSALAFIIPILLGFLQIQSMGIDQSSPFQVNPVTTMASVISIVAYYLAFGARIKFPTYVSELGIFMAASGSFSVASLVSLLLPNSWRCLSYIFYILLLVGELHQMLQSLCATCGRGLRRRRPPPYIRRRTPPLLPQTLMDLTERLEARRF